MYKIGLFSKISKTTIKTLRYYDKEGLLKPEKIDRANNYRYYSTDQLFVLHRIISLRQIGFSIQEIRNILAGQNEDQMILQRKKEIEALLSQSSDQLSRINQYILEKKEGVMLQYQAVIKDLPECIVYSKRMRIPGYDSYFQIIPEIGAKVAATNPGIECTVPAYCFNIYHDKEYKEKDIDVEYCEAVNQFGKNEDGIIFKKIPSVKAVSTLHKGPYKNLGLAYSFIFRWIEENSYEISEPPRESYIDGIWNKENEADWLTEIQIPIRKKA